MVIVTAPPNRSARIATTAGVVFRLQAGQERTLPNYVATQAVNAGCSVRYEEEASAGTAADSPENAAEPETTETEDTVVDPAVLPDVKPRLLKAAIRNLISENDVKKFTQNGPPRKAAVQALVDFDFDSRQLQAAYEEVLNGDGAGAD